MEYLKQLLELYDSKEYHGYVALIDWATNTFYQLDQDYIIIEHKDFYVKEPIGVIKVLLSAYLIDKDKVWRYCRLIDGYQLSISMNGGDKLSIHNFNVTPHKYKITTRKDLNILEFLKRPWEG